MLWVKFIIMFNKFVLIWKFYLQIRLYFTKC